MGGASFGGGKSESSSGSNQAFNQDVWGGNLNALNNMYNSGSTLFNNSMMGKNNAMRKNGGSTLASQRNLLGGGATAGMGLQNQLSESLQNSLNNPTATQEINNMIMGGAGNNYADAMRDQYINDATRAQENMLANTDARAAASGMSGSSRHGVMQALGMRDINENLQRNMAQTGYNTFDKDLDRKLAIAGQADANTLARQQMMGQMIGGQDAARMSGLNSAFQGYGLPVNAFNAYAGAIGGPTVLSSGSGSSSSSSKGTGLSMGAK